jgi:hypothetical protein
MTDIVLDDINGSYITVNAPAVKLSASDFMLDNADRRRGGGPFRRALVHDQGDGLTLNFGKDYPGGVTIEGPLHASGPANLNGGLVVHGGISYEVQGVRMDRPGTIAITVILADELAKMSALISDLTKRVAVLEARH